MPSTTDPTTPAKVAQDAEERGTGICRTCLAPIWNEGGTILGQISEPTGWSDRITQGGDSLVCFNAIFYRHVPLTGREAYIYDVALARGAQAATEPCIDHDQQCCRTHKTHVTPHRGCILR